MAYDENIYARIITGDLSTEEIERLKKTGEWQEIQKILKYSDHLAIESFDKDKGYETLGAKRSGNKNAVNHVRRMPFLLSAASILMILGAFYLINMLSEDSFHSNNTENKFVDLPDQSIVNLNDGSKVKFDSKNWKLSREVELIGEASFKVESGQVFKVLTNNGEVEVLGTYFNVRAWEDKLFVECYEGKVRVKNSESQVILTKGTSVDASNGIMNETQIIAHSKPQWTKGTSRFYSESVESVFNEMERQFDIIIEFSGPTQSFSGYFEHDELNKALTQVCAPLSLQYVIEKDKKRVIIN